MKYKVTRKMPEFHKSEDPERAMWKRKLTRASEKLDLVNLRRAYVLMLKLSDLNGLEIK